jgi:deoxyadenosine/deoxycytidine kinase
MNNQFRYIVLAGPQAAGKSTMIKGFCMQSSIIKPLQESRQIIVRKYKRSGAIFMTKEDELEVIHYDMRRMFHILDNHEDGEVYIDETNVFTLGHAKAHAIDLLEGYFKQYNDLLRALNASVIFIDVLPSLSWERRHHRYAQRLAGLPTKQVESTLCLYRAYLERLHHELNMVYKRLNIPKVRIDGSGTIAQTSLAGERVLSDIGTPLACV